MLDHPPIVAEVLQVHGHLEPHERIDLEQHWSKLDQRLQSFAGGTIEMNLFVKDRDTPSQHVTLDVKVAGHEPFVAKSASGNFGHALNEVRDEMIRQLTDAKNRTEPRNNRHLRETTRHD